MTRLQAQRSTLWYSITHWHNMATYPALITVMPVARLIFRWTLEDMAWIVNGNTQLAWAFHDDLWSWPGYAHPYSCVEQRGHFFFYVPVFCHMNCLFFVFSHIGRQAIINTNGILWSTRPMGTNFCEIWIKNSFRNVHCTLFSALWRPWCRNFDMFNPMATRLTQAGRSILASISRYLSISRRI